MGGFGRQALAAGLALSFVALAGRAAAQDSSTQELGALRDLCPDRPSKGTSPCTVDPGHIQIESGLFDGTWDRQGGVSNDSFVYASTLLKYGLTSDIDVEAGWAPLVVQRSHDRASNTTLTDSSVGDLYLRAKFNLTGNRDSGWNFALDPYVKEPVAHAPIGNGAWEGGVVAPLATNLSKDWSIDITPEFDVVENGAGDGRHTALAGSVGLTRALNGGVSVTGELWTAVDFDPVATTHQYSFDLALAWVPPKLKYLQLDTGVNLGLNRETPDVEVYVGVSRKF